MKKNKILVLGCFGYDNNQLDGQTIKSRNIYRLLQDRHNGDVCKFDTQRVRKNPLLVFWFLLNLIRCNTLIIIPSLNNLTIVFPLTYYISRIFQYEIIHVCVGGWQTEYFKGNARFKPHKLQLKLSKRIKAFLPQITGVKKDLDNMFGFTNTDVLHNFRHIDTNVVAKSHSPVLRLVFMARVSRKKGYPAIFDFAEFIKNKSFNINIDFYGSIEEADKTDFLCLIDKYSDIAKYKGILQPDAIYSTLSLYDALLLPTNYYTEGFPGSILDAYISGIPVIATSWKHAHEFVKEKKTGFIVPFDNGQDEFNARILELYNDRKKLSQMKLFAKEESLKYSEDAAWEVLNKYL